LASLKIAAYKIEIPRSISSAIGQPHIIRVQQDMFLLAGVVKNLDFKGHVLNVTTNLKGGPIFNVLVYP
jgi:hypothetical protein